MYMDFVKYIEPLLMFVHHLDPKFLKLELLVTNLQNFQIITLTKFTVKDSLHFDEEIVHQESKLFMNSLDVDLIFSSLVTYLLKRPLIYSSICFIKMKML